MFCETFLYKQKQIQINPVYVRIKKIPNTESSLKQLKCDFVFMKKVQNSIATKLCLNLLNNHI